MVGTLIGRRTRGVRFQHIIAGALWFLLALCAPASAQEWTPQQRALEKAVQRNDAAAVRSLLAGGVKAPALILVRAAGKSRPETISALVEGGVDVNAPLDLQGLSATPLGSAVLKRRADVVSLLLEGGARVEDPHLNRPPIDWAREDRYEEIVALLLAAEGRKLGSLEAALEAIANGKHADLKELLAGGQNPDEKDDNGTPLIHHAAQKGDGEAVRILLGAGADPDQRNAGGQHAAELAPGYDSVSIPLLEASPEFQENRKAPAPEEGAVYEPGTVLGGPCRHTGRIPRDAGCGSSGTEVFMGTRVSTSGWSDSVGPPLCKPVKLPPLPGKYTVMVVETTSEWIGDKCYETIGKIYFSEIKGGNTTTSSFIIKKRKKPTPPEEPEKTLLHIVRGEEQITGKKVAATIGERIRLDVVAEGGELTDPKWTLAGEYVEDFIASEGEGRVDPLEGDELEKESISYAWWKTGAFKVSVSASVDGKPKTASATFGVIAPKIRMRANKAPNGVRGILTTDEGQELTFLGKTPEGAYGIRFSHTPLPSSSGETQYVQLVKTDVRIRQQMFFRADAVHLTCQGLQEPEYVLDTSYPYPKKQETYDSPTFRLSLYEGQIKEGLVEEQLDLQMFLMYRPTTDDIFVPIWDVIWKFEADLCWGKGDEPKVATADINITRQPRAAQTWPEWNMKTHEFPDIPYTCPPKHRCDRY